MIKHSLFAAPLLLMTLSVVCQAQPLTRRFVVSFEQKTGSPNQNVFVTPDQHALTGTLSDIAHTKGYAGSGLPSDEKQVRPNGRELTTTIIESTSWQWLYANHLLLGYERILTSKNTPLDSTSYSWLPIEVVVAVGWLLTSYWDINSSSLNPMKQKELCQEQPLAAIITVPGSGTQQLQDPPPESSGQQAQGATACPTGSSNSFLYSDSAGGNGGSEQHRHTLGLDCFVFPCHGVCQFRPSSVGSGPAEGAINFAEHSTDHTEATPEQSSCPHLDNGHCPECLGHGNNTDVLLMDGIAHPPDPNDTVVMPEAESCPICLTYFHGRDVAPVIVEAQCCRKHFDLDCISKSFVKQPIGSRQCAMCRQDPMPMLNKNTGEYHPDKFFPEQTFFNACIVGDLDQLDKAVVEGVNVNAFRNDDFNALMMASSHGHVEIAERLIEAGADVNAARAEDGATPLLIAAQEGHTDIVKVLLEAKAHLNARDKDGATPLYVAAGQGHSDIVQLLIEARADLNARKKHGATPLFIAALMCHTDIAKLLIEAKADINARNNNGSTPLFAAVQEGHTDIVKLLIEAKADINARTLGGFTALFAAAKENDIEIMKILISAGADVNARSEYGATPLLTAISVGNTNSVKALIEAEADLNVGMPDGITPVFVATEKGNTD